MRNLDYLTDLQINNLIKSLKELQKTIPSEMPEFGRIKDDTPVLGFHENIEYKLHRYRHPMEKDRFSLHLRFKDTNDILIRVDINNGSHRNPDGTMIGQNHIHIYKDTEFAKDAFAYPLPSEISNVESIFSALEDFLRYTNTKEQRGD